MEEEIEEVCPTCEFNVIDTDPTKPTTVPQAVSAGLKQHPDTEWIFPAFDSVMPLVTEGIKLNGATDKMKIVGSDNTPEQLAELSDPNSPFEADVGNNVGWQGWAEIDLIGRAMAGEEPTSYELPLRMFTKDSLPSDPEGNWTGVDYPAEYKKIWGV
jgi:ribose transport system substrate-binding protein